MIFFDFSTWILIASFSFFSYDPRQKTLLPLQFHHPLLRPRACPPSSPSQRPPSTSSSAPLPFSSLLLFRLQSSPVLASEPKRCPPSQASFQSLETFPSLLSWSLCSQEEFWQEEPL